MYLVWIKVLDWLWGQVHDPARWDISLAVAPPLIDQPALGWVGGIHLSIPLHLVARASVTGEQIFEVLVPESRAEVAERWVAGVWGEWCEAGGEEGSR